MANEERAKTNGHSANTSISYNTHSYTGGRLVVIPLKRAFRGGSSSKRCRGSSCSRAVVEVVILATVVEVDLHGSSWEVVVHVVTVVEVVVHGVGSGTPLKTYTFRR